MAHQPAHWPDDHDDPPVGVTIRPVHRLPDQLPSPTIPPLRTIPQNRANGDHLLIGPPGVFLVDSKAWHGRITLAPDGSAWHNGHPMGGVLETVRWEAEQLTKAIGAPVIPMLCVHDTQLPWGELYTDGIPVLTPSRLLATLLALPPHLDATGVMLLAEEARHQLHPAV